MTASSRRMGRSLCRGFEGVPQLQCAVLELDLITGAIAISNDMAIA